MTIVPVDIELGVSEAIAVSLMMIHGRIETHHIKLNIQIKHNKRSLLPSSISHLSSYFLHVGYTVHA
jgi:hypothetical protein